MQPHRAEFGAIRSAFANRNYTIFVVGGSAALVGLWVQRLTVGWLTWALTESGFWLGAMAFADLFPAVIVGPLAGVLADRLDRMRLARICHWLMLVQAVMLFALTASGTINLFFLVALALFLGIVRAVFQPVRLSLVPALVRKADVPSAVAILFVIFNLALFIGPALAGVIITTFGVAAAFGFCAVAMMAMLFALSRIDIPRGRAPAKLHTGMLVEFMQGIHYTARHEAVGASLVLMLVVCLLARPVAELLPGFADTVFGMGAGGLAWLTSAIGFGAAIGGVWLARRGNAAGLVSIALASGAAAAGSLLLFAGAQVFWVAVLAMVGLGVSIVSTGITTQTLISGAVEDKMLGRVFSLYGVIFRGGPAVGALILGASSGPFGLRAPVAAAGVLCVIAAALLWRRRRRLVELLERDDAG